MSGVRVLDVGTFLAGPHAASILGEFGAEVLKIEHPIAGDPMRRFGTPTKRHDATLAWLTEGRNRKSVTVDLRQEEGVKIFLRLVAKSDVLIENFRPGTMEEWGLGWPILTGANPGLVMLRVSGYGQTGPYRRRSGFAHIAHAFGGLSYLAGFPGETPVVPGTVPLGDYTSSLYGAIGILLALRHRDKTGRGQVIDIGIYEAVFRQLDEIAGAYGMFGTVREREVQEVSWPYPTDTFARKTTNGLPSRARLTRCSNVWPRRWGSPSWRQTRSMASSANGWPLATWSIRSSSNGSAPSNGKKCCGAVWKSRSRWGA